MNAFRLYEEHSSGGLIMNAFTAISPYATMHDDVCTLALEKRTSMVLIPFHKQFNDLSGAGVLDNNPIRSVNRNILQNSPCSVGILLDRGTLNTNVTLSCKTSYNFGMIFVEGPDDREALAYAMRMAEHPNVSLTVVRLVDHNMKQSVNRDLDMVVISKCKIAIAGRKQHVYKEEHVKDSVDMINVIRSNSMENLYDLILVGRRHDSNSPLFMGLTEWNEFPELGFIGDMLASSDSNCDVSVLVVQQQMLGSDRLMVSDSSFNSKEKEASFSIVDMPRDDRVHPVAY
ncbi:cation/H(+) antiporter 15-like [Prunus yedoensis var. nudiflora]|uniref:Cation/H(+) antiporter 15-like n=1 Tax=Prunus yedoensis var. nudiflora TaxID=2094558 RepID=A0A314UU80_PRUYE|nr:cation/H(+) antiporter 15-like [Prunus yedoensis var. nudiflora]